jgi:radical SAM protein with 4Fe4S-binding SPASM domain
MTFYLNRYTNSVKGIFSYVASAATGRPLMWGMPFSAGVELTNLCNLECPECASGSGLMKRHKGFMNMVLFDKIISEADSALLHLNLFFQGEPMLHPEFFRFINKASGFRTTVSTNGHFLNEENATKLASSSLGRLIVSLDGMDNDTYLIYRKRGDFATVIEGIRHVSEAIRKRRSSLRLEIQFIVNRHNESQIPAARRFASEVTATLRLKSMQVMDIDRAGEWMPQTRSYSRYQSSDGSFRIKSTLTNRCSRLWFNPVITWDGLVLPCCFDKDANHVMGDINESSLSEIWYGKKYMEFRKLLLHDRQSIEICGNCTTGLKGISL